MYSAAVIKYELCARCREYRNAKKRCGPYPPRTCMLVALKDETEVR